MITINAKVMNQNIKDLSGFYVFGRITYYDELKRQQRETRFCDGVLPLHIENQEVSYETVATKTGNCMDERCNQEDRENKHQSRP